MNDQQLEIAAGMAGNGGRCATWPTELSAAK